MEDILSEVVEVVFEALLNSRRVPKIVKYLIIIVVCGLIIGLGLMLGLSNDVMLIGRILGFVLAVLFVILGIYLISKIRKS